MDTMIDADGVTLPDSCTEEMDMIGIGHILDTVPHGPHFDFDLFGVSVIDTDDVTLYDACIDEMDMIGTDHILDAASHGPRFALDMFGAFMHEIDDDDSVTIVTPDVITIEGASDSVDQPLSFDTMSGFVTHFDDVAGGNNNDMSDGKVRVCVDFQDLNKASPKDDFPFPHIDMLVNSTAGHSMLSFMDGFSGYNQILMALEDMGLIDICEPIFRLLRKSQPTIWDDDCQRAFKKIKECLLSSPVLVLPTPRCHLFLYLSVLDIAMGCMLAQLDDSGKERPIYYLNPLRYLFDKPVLIGRLIKWLVLLTEFDIQLVDDDFPNEQFVSVTSIAGWKLYFDSATNQSGFGIDILLISPQGDHIPKSIRLAFSDHHQLTNNIIEYEACITSLETVLNLGVRQLEIHGDSNLVIQQTQTSGGLGMRKNQFADALATLASVIEIPTRVTVQPLLIETKFALAYCCLIRDIKDLDGLPWYHDIYQFLSCGAYPESATIKDRRALRQLAARFVICGKSLYRKSFDGLLLLCLHRASTDRVMREVRVGVCGPHMRGHMLAQKIMRTSDSFPIGVSADSCPLNGPQQWCHLIRAQLVP
ncbi:hypothetical protein CK203_063596 [Vitis vinifera]|uniref:Reverse transcriptase/retrotransposon-derived protein RNase H-like domain-containing protein n=1 Tax=Vitis vinifera TaxID=29760 RepID=A0A438G378_VITVI|nr:hypothetical protein CK203_063596 [Vitis vinifera]